MNEVAELELPTQENFQADLRSVFQGLFAWLWRDGRGRPLRAAGRADRPSERHVPAPPYKITDVG